tara:strand:- start:34014 stop:35486 length:1473 start_codon:yes stop_codon:yes gene_type:complete
MKLYHGTTETIARKAMVEGIVPRGNSGATGNWEHSVPSGDDRVYMTAGYAPYFAGCVAEDGEKWGIVEIETSKIYRSFTPVYEQNNTNLVNDLHGSGHGVRLLPDEDFLEQMMRQYSPEKLVEISLESGDRRLLDMFDGFPWESGMEERTIWLRDNIQRFAHMAEDSIKFLGNCSYKGVIPARAITRVAIYDPLSNPHMTMAAMDPTISCMNWSICQNKYTETTRWFMGYDDIDINKITSVSGLTNNDPADMDREQLKRMEELVVRIQETVEGCKSGEITSMEEIEAKIYAGEFSKPVDESISHPVLDQLKAGRYGSKEEGLRVMEDYLVQMRFVLGEVQRRDAWVNEVIPNRSGIEVIRPAQYGTGSLQDGLVSDIDVLLERLLDKMIPNIALLLESKAFAGIDVPDEWELTKKEALSRDNKMDDRLVAMSELGRMFIATAKGVTKAEIPKSRGNQMVQDSLFTVASKYGAAWSEGYKRTLNRYGVRSP